MVIYEHPLNNKIRIWLRFSRLFERMESLINSDLTDWDYFGFHSLFELLELTETSDIRGDILMELERFHQFLQTLANNPEINPEAWNDTVHRTLQASLDLRSSPARPAHVLCANPWVSLLRSRMVVAGGCNDFDVPSYHWWRHLPTTRKRANLQQFQRLYSPYFVAINTLLENIRHTAEYEHYTMINGAITLNLVNARPVALIRLELPDDCRYYPEISANRHIVNIRMLALGEGNWETQKVSDNGKIAICQCSMPTLVG